MKNIYQKKIIENKPVPKNSLICGKNVYLSKDCHETWNNNNVLVVGTTGCGKTSCMVEPALLQADSSYVVSDPKGALKKKYAPYLESLGYAIYKMDFIHPEKSAHYNPIQYCMTTQDIMKLAHTLTYSLEGGNHSIDPFWDETSSILLSALIGYMVEEESYPAEEKNIIFLLRLLESAQREPGKTGFGDSKLGRRLKEHDEWMRQNKNKGSWAYHRFCQLSTAADKTFGTIIVSACSKLAFFDTEELHKMFSDNSINFPDLGTKKVAIFVEVSDSERSMDTLVNLFYSQLINTLCMYADEKCKNNSLPIPVQLILDDFATNTKIDNFDNIISNIRSRNISAMLMVQSEFQLDQGYGVYGGRTISNNCSTYVYLGGMDPKLAEFVAPRMEQDVHTILTMPINMCYVQRRGRESIYCEHFDTEWYKKQVGFEDGKPYKGKAKSINKNRKKTEQINPTEEDLIKKDIDENVKENI